MSGRHGARRARAAEHDRSESEPYDERPVDETPVHTADLPATPIRDRNIPATAWVEAPDELLTLGADLPGTPVAEYKRRIGAWLLWRAGPASGGDARYWAARADDTDDELPPAPVRRRPGRGCRAERHGPRTLPGVEGRPPRPLKLTSSSARLVAGASHAVPSGARSFVNRPRTHPHRRDPCSIARPPVQRVRAGPDWLPRSPRWPSPPPRVAAMTTTTVPPPTTPRRTPRPPDPTPPSARRRRRQRGHARHRRGHGRPGALRRRAALRLPDRTEPVRSAPLDRRPGHPDLHARLRPARALRLDRHPDPRPRRVVGVLRRRPAS